MTEGPTTRKVGGESSGKKGGPLGAIVGGSIGVRIWVAFVQALPFFGVWRRMYALTRLDLRGLFRHEKRRQPFEHCIVSRGGRPCYNSVVTPRVNSARRH